MAVDDARKQYLEKNSSRLFWIRALLNIKMLNIVLSLFYLSRGIALSEIFLLNLFWAAGSLVFEIPSSYLADRWGRKKTIMLGTSLMVLHWVVLFFAEGFAELSIAMIVYGVSFACFSGTDQALLYDTERELGREVTTLDALGKFHAAARMFKVVAPVLGVLIAKDLSPLQFRFLIGIDVVATLMAVWLSVRLTEPRHTMDVEKIESGIFFDAWRLLRNDALLFRTMLNKEVVFFSVFICWSFFQKFFFDRGISILVIGAGWAARHGVVFLYLWYISRFQKGKNLLVVLDRYNTWFLTAFFFFLIALFAYPQPILLFFLFLAFTICEGIRYPLFDEFFHKRFFSYNRATTVSLSNLLHNVLEFPLLIGASFIIVLDPRYTFLFSFAIGCIAVVFLSLKHLAEIRELKTI
ncbi:MAG TPA: hypothetical protein DCY48_03710 [Candidatus Magasanikbacteria bacterium]|nr:MAG: hypothetical protein A3I74_04565 [Candidatus Magasanikbacteria bacterium RIFCSPLOWO2_02_FULL_47_16]OGH79480.1 MAG: hypothetical protein A3C10_01535 [Candidatus Magasanikbacteria bacterium RIFCSPHIGHO2_02_FULL_48_18]HAZ28851.1 hypothetical protein [Candidatus Magasanikbacteria bacterium]